MNPDTFLPALRLIHMGFLLHDPPLAVPPCVGDPDGGEDRLSTVSAQGEVSIAASLPLCLCIPSLLQSKERLTCLCISIDFPPS